MTRRPSPCRLLPLLIAVCLGLALRADADTFTAHDLLRLRQVTSVAISPDGEQVAYTLEAQRKPMKDEDGPAYNELHVVDAAGRSRPFITGAVNVSAVRWTPDGRFISYLAKRKDDDHKVLYALPIEGGESRRLVTHDPDIRDYSWSPDGKRVAFIAAEKEPGPREELKKKGFDAVVYEEDLEPVRVWIAEIDFETEATEPRMLKLEGSAVAVEWSPAGSRLAVALAPTPLIDDVYMRSRIRIVDAESAETVTRIENSGKLGEMAWSPDGKHLAFTSGLDINDPSPGRLMIASVEDGRFSEAAPDYRPDFSDIEWQDSRTVMFIANDGCYTAFGEVRLIGKNVTIHVPANGPIMTSFSLSRDGTCAAFLTSTPNHPPEVYRMCHGDERATRLTDSNPWLKEMELAPHEVVEYRARDGESIQGVLIRPLNEEAGKRYPLILYVHGGPETQIQNGWNTRYNRPGQIAAAQGYAVFHPNYRGSTGRGVAFAKAHQADYAGKEFDDLIDGVDHLIAGGLVDGDKVGVTGGSYGGFATAWCATRYTERFAAAVMFVGVSDLISKGGTTDIANEMYLVHARKYVWEDWSFFLERSPIRYVEQARTPILIAHGKKDTRVSPTQSMELYRYLKQLDRVPVRLVLYPGEGHGNRATAARLDFAMRLMRWMNHYLKGPGGDPPPPSIEYGLEEPEQPDHEEHQQPQELDEDLQARADGLSRREMNSTDQTMSIASP